MKSAITKICLIVIISICSLTDFSAQVSVDWLHSYQTGRVKYGEMATNINNQGDVYYLLNFKDTVKRQVLNNNDSLITNGVQMQIIKSNVNGQILQFMVFDNAWGDFIEIDSSDNIIVSGNFDGITDFNPDPSIFFPVRSDTIGNNARFILKLNKVGDFQWVNCIGGFALQNRALAIGPHQEIIHAGMFYGTVDFDPTTAVNNITGNFFDMYIQKLDSNGMVQLTYTYVSNGSNLVREVAIDDKGNFYAVGSCNNIDFDPSPAASPLQNNAKFLVKYNHAGLYQWVQYWEVTPTCINIDYSSGDIYVGGEFNGTRDFNPGTLSQLFTATGRDAFAIRLDSNANFIWGKSFGNSGNESMESMDFKNPQLMLGIGFEDSVDVSTSTIHSNRYVSHGGSDLLLLSCDSSGQIITVDHYGSSGNDQFHSIKIKNAQTNYFSGAYENSIFFSPSGNYDAGVPYNLVNFFIVQAKKLTIGLKDSELEESSEMVYPNPTNGILHISSNDVNELSIFNLKGIRVQHLNINQQIQRINLSQLPKGIYMFQFVRDSGITSFQKVILN